MAGKLLGGLFGVISKNDISKDLFFGIDYHSHLGTEIGGFALYDKDIKIYSKNISNSQFKTKFQEQYDKMDGNIGIGVISDADDEQPIKFESKIGCFALCTVGLIKNLKSLYFELIELGVSFKKSGEKSGKTTINQTEVVGELICKGKNIVDGIEKMYQKIHGSVSLIMLSKEDKQLYISGDAFPLVIGKRGDDWAVASETSAFPNLKYNVFKFLEYREIISIGVSGVKTRIKNLKKNKFCPFLHVYFGFPTSDYYGINAEIVRERCGGFLAEKDNNLEADLVLGIADSGFPHSIGYVKRKITLAKEQIPIYFEMFKEDKIDAKELENKINKIVNLIPPLRRSLVKYTPGWGRSYIPSTQEERELVASYKQIPNPQIIKGLKIILVDDSIRRGTQLKNLLREKVWSYQPKEVHGRISSPPQFYPCIYDVSTKKADLAVCKAMEKVETDKNVEKYLNYDDEEYAKVVEEIRKMLGFTTLKFQNLDKMIEAIIGAPNNMGLKKENLCLYCWTGKI